jgi:hypothetical protein
MTNLCNALAKGALIWAPAYAVGASTAACGLSSFLTESTPDHMEMLMHALMLFSPLCMVGACTRWILIHHAIDCKDGGNRSNKRSKGSRLTARFLPTGLRPKNA